MVRVLTPGTLTDSALLDDTRDNWLLALSFGEGLVGFARINLASGDLILSETPPGLLAQELERIAPAELLFADNVDHVAIQSNACSKKRLSPWQFDLDSANEVLTKQFNTHDLDGYGCADLTLAIAAAGALLDYVKHTQRTTLPHINGLIVEQSSQFVQLDAATRRNLEIDQTIRGEVSPTLYSLINTTQTAMGARMLRFWLHHPLRDLKEVSSRHDAVAALIKVDDPSIRQSLRHVGDIERLTTRIALKTARPRDLSALRDSLMQFPNLQSSLDNLDADLIKQISAHLIVPQKLSTLLIKAIQQEPSTMLRDGGVIADGYDAELDELRGLQSNCGDFLLKYEAEERERTGLANLKVEYNSVHGFYIEISRAQAENAPLEYRRRQTLKNAERFITPELKTFEDKVLSANERALAREKILFESVIDALSQEISSLQANAFAIGQLDVLSTFAERAIALNYVAPEFVIEEGIHIVGGRHPVVEQIAQPFIANDVVLSPYRQMLLITGPNMGGKSTFMRQTALIVLLAHCGCFVPANSAKIGKIDRIFTRIGASDDLAGGRSTFMVEMTETANILNNATPHSLVLLDEIGRGTSTFDGLSLAWACGKQLLERNRSYTLFATHYFELTRLVEEFKQVANVHLDAAEHGNSIVFLHSVQEGAANQSYGLQVAALAGIPKSVVASARRKLTQLENQNIEAGPQSDMFVAEMPVEMPLHPVVGELEILDPDDLTPKQALEALYKLKSLM